MKRLISSLVIAIFAIAIAPLQVLATNTVTTGSWTWTDVSDYVSNRTNRPIWAMAHANAGWYYTDGQNLWNGGQVYRFDGTTNVTVTTEVRNAGLDRVDDIVSDGADTIIFLQDVVRLDNQFRIVVNKNGSYYNATDAVRNVLRSNEGISSISGRNGTWYIVTTNCRLFRWYANTTAPIEVTSVPTRSGDTVCTSVPSSMIYHVGQTAFNRMKMVPIGNSDWFFMREYFFGAGYVTFGYKYDGSTFTAISNSVLFNNNNGTKFLVSNGQTAIFEQGRESSKNGIIARYDGTNFSKTTTSSNAISSTITATAWDGTSWILISGNKEVIRMLPNATTVEQHGTTRDYFITASGDNNGHILLGGTVSQLGLIGPTSPLTAKLVGITENGATIVTPNTTTPSTTNGTTDGSSGITKFEWIDPNTTTLANNSQTTYHATASDGNGIASMEIYVNGIVKRTCNLGNASGNQDCSVTLYASEYLAGTNIFVNTKITDGIGNITWTTGMTITRPNSTTNSSSGATNSIWTWLDPSATSIYSNESIAYHAGAWDGDGVNRIIISINGSDVKTCNLSNSTASVECSTTVYGSNYSAYSTITLRARYVDGVGNTVYSDTSSLYRYYGTSSDSSNSDGTITTSVWLEPTDTTIETDETTEFHISAKSNGSVRYITVYVNGSALKACNYTESTIARECVYTLYGSTYTAGSDVFMNALVTDYDGNQTWTNSKSVSIVANSSGSNSNNSNGWVDVTTNRESGFTTGQSITITATSGDNDGVARTEIYINGVRTKVCTGSTSCSITVMPPSYGNYFNYAGTMVDTNGNIVTTGYQQITRK